MSTWSVRIETQAELRSVPIVKPGDAAYHAAKCIDEMNLEPGVGDPIFVTSLEALSLFLTLPVPAFKLRGGVQKSIVWAFEGKSYEDKGAKFDPEPNGTRISASTKATYDSGKLP